MKKIFFATLCFLCFTNNISAQNPEKKMMDSLLVDTTANRVSSNNIPVVSNDYTNQLEHALAKKEALEQKRIEQAVLMDKRPKMFGIILCLYTGLRIGELLALEWTDIDFSKGELTVSKTCHDAKTENG